MHSGNLIDNMKYEQAKQNNMLGGECVQARQGRPLMVHEHQMRATEHTLQAERATKAAQFFANNPAFDEFIRLIREGIIQI